MVFLVFWISSSQIKFRDPFLDRFIVFFVKWDSIVYSSKTSLQIRVEFRRKQQKKEKKQNRTLKGHSNLIMNS